MWLQLAAGCLAAAFLVGPTLLALAQCPPVRAATSWTPLRLLAVKAFPDLGADGCIYDLPVHAGPTAVQGRVIEQWALQSRLTGAVFACARDGWTGDVTISATVDGRGNITDVLSQGNASPIMASCLTAHVLEGDPIAARGPGTLRASYFMGQRGSR
jgi:hypothetical protein